MSVNVLKNKVLWLLLFVFVPIFAWSQGKNEVRGCVLDEQTGEPIPLVHVQLNDSNSGTITDIDGCFVITTESEIKSLIFSHLNYEPLLFPVGRKGDQPIFVYLKQHSFELEVVEVFPGENPAHRLIDSVVAHIAENNPKNLESFSHKIYEKFRMTLEKDDDSGVEQPPDSLVLVNQDDSLAMQLRTIFAEKDLFLSESVIERTYVKPNQLYDKVTASRVSGLKEPFFSLLITRLQSFTFYDPMLSVAGEDYVNPVSKGSTKKYFFLLQDTVFSEVGDSIFVIYYRPLKNKLFDGLEGVLYINQNGWAVQSATAKPFKQNSSFDISIHQVYKQLDDGHWFPNQLESTIEIASLPVTEGTDSTMHFGSFSNPLVIRVLGRSYFSDIVVNQPIRTWKLGEVGVEYMPKYGNQDSIFWASHRFTPLSVRDEKTYQFIDSVGKADEIESLAKWMLAFAEGNIKVGFLNFPFDKIIDFSDYQGFYLGIGAVTNDQLSRFFSLGGYFGYGFGDKHIKYGVAANFNCYRPRNITLKLEYSDDVEEVGLLKLPFQSHRLLKADNYKHFFFNRVDYTKTLGGTMSINPLPYFQTEIGLYLKRQNPNYEYAYLLQSPDKSSNFAFTEFHVGVRWAFREQKIKNFYNAERLLGTKFPVVLLNYTRGISHFLGGEYDYNRFDISVEQKIESRFLGETSLTLHVGLVSPEVPYSKLYNPAASYATFTLYAPHTFGTMRHDEFINDHYTALFFSHNFKQLLFKPNSKWFTPEPEIVTNIGFGWLKHPEYHSGVSMQSMELGYYESGLNLHNIVRVSFLGIGVGFLYRYGAYALPKTWDNFALKFTLSINGL